MRTLAITLLGLFLLLPPNLPSAASDSLVGLELGIDDDEFTVNDDPRFLVFVSYFDAFDVSSTNLEADFSDLEDLGVDGVRIFVNWWSYSRSKWDHPNDSPKYANDTLIDKNGNLRAASLTKLLQVLDIAKDEGLLVDLTFSAETVGDCPSADCTTGPSLSLTEYKDGIKDLTTTLAGYGSDYKHVFFDLQNEFDQNSHVGVGTGYTTSEILGIRNAVKAIDSGRIVTASIAGDIDADDAGD